MASRRAGAVGNDDLREADFCMSAFDEPVTLSWPLRRPIRRSEETDPARAQWIDLIWRDPAAARRERRRLRIEAARRRVATIEARLRKAEGKRKKWREVAATVEELRRDLAVAQAELRQAEMDS
jgi:PAS domain-containing protein